MIPDRMLFRPDQVERGFSASATLIPGSNALLIDRRVLVYATDPNRGKGITDISFFVNASRGVPIVFQKDLYYGVNHEGEIDYYRDEERVVFGKFNKTDEKLVFVGNEYEVIFTDVTRKRVSVRVQSAKPLHTEAVRISTQLLPLLKEARS